MKEVSLYVLPYYTQKDQYVLTTIVDIKNITDNKKFWQTVKPLFGNSGATTQKINLFENEEVLADKFIYPSTHSSLHFLFFFAIGSFCLGKLS